MNNPSTSLLPPGYFYSPLGYLWYILPVEAFVSLPQTVEVAGESLVKKTEFHVTVVHGRGIARMIAGEDSARALAIEEELQKLLADYVAETPIKFVRFEDDLRLADKEGLMSVAARCTMENIEGYFERIRTVYGKAIPTQPTHVSLYTRGGGEAVGIDSLEEMEAFEKIELPLVGRVLGRGTL